MWCGRSSEIALRMRIGISTSSCGTEKHGFGGIIKDTAHWSNRLLTLRRAGSGRNVWYRLRVLDGLPSLADHFTETFGDLVPVEHVHFEREARFREGFFQSDLDRHGQRGGGHYYQIEIGVWLRAAANARAERADRQVRHMRLKNSPNCFQVWRVQFKHDFACRPLRREPGLRSRNGERFGKRSSLCPRRRCVR